MEELKYRAPQLVIAAIARRYAPDQALTVLDAGCGTGLCGPALAPYAKHMVGVDLSEAMIQKARDRQAYHELVVAELTGYLQSQPAKFDLIVSADTLVYFGALEEVIAAAAGALRDGGHLVFTVERLQPSGGAAGDFFLNPHGRYSHGEAYLRRRVAGTGFELVSLHPETLRLENGLPVEGFVVAACKQGALT
jgi:predicted TPR repeat methyltransferase